MERLRNRQTQLGPMTIWRALPVREHRTIGPWCFLDRYGPISFTDAKPMDVAPHPHIGIRTVSWLLDGEVLHRDSLGCEAMARPGAVNIMTSGRGIAHAEETPRENRGSLNGVQLWVALKDADRNVAPSFEHIPEVPRDEPKGAIVQTFCKGPDIVGADVEVRDAVTLELDRAFEHGVFVAHGNPELEGQRLETNTLYYLEPGRSELSLEGGSRVLLLGGPPFPETILMWWNFVARTPEEIAEARAAWAEGRWGEVRGYDGPRIEAPALGRLAAPNPAS
jgi:redox-sensitive bicupin YhaK (pirin superfamily)